jgi:hypothetical protein
MQDTLIVTERLDLPDPGHNCVSCFFFSIAHYLPASLSFRIMGKFTSLFVSCKKYNINRRITLFLPLCCKKYIITPGKWKIPGKTDSYVASFAT